MASFLDFLRGDAKKITPQIKLIPLGDEIRRAIVEAVLAPVVLHMDSQDLVQAWANLMKRVAEFATLDGGKNIVQISMDDFANTPFELQLCPQRVATACRKFGALAQRDALTEERSFSDLRVRIERRLEDLKDEALDSQSRCAVLATVFDNVASIAHAGAPAALKKNATALAVNFRSLSENCDQIRGVAVDPESRGYLLSEFRDLHKHASAWFGSGWARMRKGVWTFVSFLVALIMTVVFYKGNELVALVSLKDVIAAYCLWIAGLVLLASALVTAVLYMRGRPITNIFSADAIEEMDWTVRLQLTKVIERFASSSRARRERAFVALAFVAAVVVPASTGISVAQWALIHAQHIELSLRQTDRDGRCIKISGTQMFATPYQRFLETGPGGALTVIANADVLAVGNMASELPCPGALHTYAPSPPVCTQCGAVPDFSHMERGISELLERTATLTSVLAGWPRVPAARDGLTPFLKEILAQINGAKPALDKSVGLLGEGVQIERNTAEAVAALAQQFNLQNKTLNAIACLQYRSLSTDAWRKLFLSSNFRQTLSGCGDNPTQG